MPEVIGIDHFYITGSVLAASERFYDIVLIVLGLRKARFQIDGEDHIQYNLLHRSR